MAFTQIYTHDIDVHVMPPLLTSHGYPLSASIHGYGYGCGG